jgi:DNA-binding sugar fermentation-stimulating protein
MKLYLSICCIRPFLFDRIRVGFNLPSWPGILSNCLSTTKRITRITSNAQHVGTKEPFESIKNRFAVLRVDTHGNRFVVAQNLPSEEAKRLEKEYDELPHHQGYYVVDQSKVAEELTRVF